MPAVPQRAAPRARTSGFRAGSLAHVLQEFQGRYPQIVPDISVNDAAVDPVREGIDCALQIFPPRSEELVALKLFRAEDLLRFARVRPQARPAGAPVRAEEPPHRLVFGLLLPRATRL